MKNDLLHHHPDERVRAAAIHLLDALCSWERSTGRENVVIIKCTSGFDYRSFSGAPQPEHVTDAQMLEAFEYINRHHNQ